MTVKAGSSATQSPTNLQQRLLVTGRLILQGDLTSVLTMHRDTEHRTGCVFMVHALFACNEEVVCKVNMFAVADLTVGSQGAKRAIHM